MVNHPKAEVFSRRMEIVAIFKTAIYGLMQITEEITTITIVDRSLVGHWGDFACSGSLDYLENSLTPQFESISTYQASLINHL